MERGVNESVGPARRLRVAIIGAGPSGSTLAILLAREGDARLFFWHTTVDAALISFGSIALVVLGRFAGLDRGTFGVPGIIAGMVIVQSLLLFPYHLDLQEPWRAISGLHVVNGVAIFAIALRLMDRLRQDQLLAPPCSCT